MSTRAPLLTAMVQLPLAPKTHLCLQNNAIIKDEFYMFAMTGNTFNS
jgi:hypothetical protein